MYFRVGEIRDGLCQHYLEKIRIIDIGVRNVRMRNMARNILIFF